MQNRSTPQPKFAEKFLKRAVDSANHDTNPNAKHILSVVLFRARVNTRPTYDWQPSQQWLIVETQRLVIQAL